LGLTAVSRCIRYRGLAIFPANTKGRLSDDFRRFGIQCQPSPFRASLQ
jgi:hypothetical protein